MGISLPTPDDLEKLKNGLDDATAIQQASDLFSIATGLEEDPTIPREFRLMKQAILEMANFLQINADYREDQYKPFQSETIGSYSYTKMSRAIQSGDSTGVQAFDFAVDYFNDKVSGSSIWSSSEHVFVSPYEESQPVVTSYDPSYSFTFES